MYRSTAFVSTAISHPRTISALIDIVAHRTPTKVALKALQHKQQSQQQQLQQQHSVLVPVPTSVSYTYEQLSDITNSLAGFLSLYGYEKNDVIVTDASNHQSTINVSVEHLLLQLACNRIGVIYGTTTSIENMAKHFTKVKGAFINISDSEPLNNNNISFLSTINLPFPYLSINFISELLSSNNSNNSMLKEFSNDMYDVNNNETSNSNKDTTHGYYNTSIPYTNQQAIQHGIDTTTKLSMSSDDIVCVPLSLLNQPFGIGIAICSTLYVGGTIILPSTPPVSTPVQTSSTNQSINTEIITMPSSSSSSIFDALSTEKCSILFADTNILSTLNNGVPKAAYGNKLYPIEPSDLPSFRGGMCLIDTTATTGSADSASTITKLAGVTMKNYMDN